MRIITVFITALLLISQTIFSQPGTSWYLPDDVSYNTKIITPGQFFGHQIGEWHLSHDKLYYYMQELARSSDRALWEEYARSHEGRPLGHLIISSPENIRNLEKLRLEHISLADPGLSSGVDIGRAPVFIKLGYGIHGNESSSQNASVL
ncbi:MAG: zinc carboxypeptidase, partial [Bacteroidales bacterium]|nr:zinc carboxypeptidase [Bacteroidales bacterium]